MVPVALAVGRDVDDPARSASPTEQPADERLARREHALESDGARDRPVVEKENDGSPRAIAMEIPVRDARIDAAVADVGPVVLAQGPHAFGLVGREDCEGESFVDERREGRVVARRFGEPERLGLSSEAMAEIGDAPAHLRQAIALVAEGQDRVVIALGDGIAVPFVGQRAHAVGPENAFVSDAVVALHPREERRPEVEADALEVVHDLFDARVAVENPGERVRAVAFLVDALVPVVERVHFGFAVDGARPRIFARGLVEVPVDDEVGHDAFFSWAP